MKTYKPGEVVTITGDTYRPVGTIGVVVDIPSRELDSAHLVFLDAEGVWLGGGSVQNGLLQAAPGLERVKLAHAKRVLRMFEGRAPSTFWKQLTWLLGPIPDDSALATTLELNK